MDALTIHEAAEVTGWSARMLRYIERIGLVSPGRSASGYRLYGPAQLQRLRTLRELLAEHELELGDVGFALRLRRETGLAAAVQDWLDEEESRAPGFIADIDAANLRERVAKDLKALREAAGLTQAQLAERLGIKQPVVAKVESGNTNTSHP